MSKSLTKNAAFHVLYTVLNVIFPLVTATYVARVIGPEGVGKVGYAQNIVSYFVMFAVLGIPSYGLREIARTREDPAAKAKLFSELVVINAISTGICSLAFYGLAFSGLFGPPAVYLACGTELLLNLINIDWFYQGEEEYVYITLRSVLIKILSLAALFLFVRTAEDVFTYALIHCLGAGGNHIFNILHARKKVKLTFRGLALKRHWKPILMLTLSTVAASLYTRVGVTVLGSVCPEESVAFYTNAHKVVSIGLTGVTAISAVFMPRLSYLYRQRREEFQALITGGTKIILFLAVPCCLGLILVAGDLIPVVFGESFAPAASVLRIMSVLTIIIGLGDLLCYQAVISSGNENALLTARLVAGGVNILLSGLLIPKLHHNGAAIALVVSELTVNGLLLKYALSIAKPRLNLRYWASLLGSGAVMTAAVAAVQRLIASPGVSLAVSVAVGVAVYFLSAWILKNETLLACVSRLRGKKTAHMQNVPVDEPEVS